MEENEKISASGIAGIIIAEAAGVREEHLLSTELFLYPRTRAVQTGLQGEFIVSPLRRDRHKGSN